MGWRKIVATLCLALAVSGCNAFPGQGPRPEAVTGIAIGGSTGLPYSVVELSPAVIAVHERASVRSLGGIFATAATRAPALRLGIGDIVGITIFEAAAGGLFIPSDAGSRPGNYVSLPAQEVGRGGTISVPFAGEVQAAGRTTVEVQRAIESRLRNRAIEPQALVTLQEARSAIVSVTGEVNQPVRFAITRTGDRILDAIAKAGGSKWPAFETYVQLLRGGRTGTVYFNRLLSDPDNNIHLQPGDTIVLKREARAFTALGASGRNGQIDFGQEDLTLAEAVGRAGGILDSRGDPSQTFLYRLEPLAVAQRLGLVTGPSDETVAVVYRVNLREPEGFFLASKFPMHHRDVLFVSNAPTAELTKLLNLVQAAASPIVEAEAARISLGGR